MAAAVVRASHGTGASVTWATAEGGLKWNRDEGLTVTTAPIPIPTSAGTNYSWIKNLALEVTTTGTTNMSNRRISMATSPAAGLTYDWKAVADASYVRGNVATITDNATTNDAVPAGYTAMTTTPAVYDAASVATSSAAVNGGMAVCAVGLAFTYAGGPGTNNASPSLTFTYDEA